MGTLASIHSGLRSSLSSSGRSGVGNTVVIDARGRGSHCHWGLLVIINTGLGVLGPADVIT